MLAVKHLHSWLHHVVPMLMHSFSYREISAPESVRVWSGNLTASCEIPNNSVPKKPIVSLSPGSPEYSSHDFACRGTVSILDHTLIHTDRQQVVKRFEVQGEGIYIPPTLTKSCEPLSKKESDALLMSFHSLALLRQVNLCQYQHDIV